ncbi:MAG: CHAT domain-containing protein [Bdellovibrio bacteriovorus]
MDAPYPELEIGLHRVQADAYQVELRFLDPASDAETAPHRSPCPLDIQGLLPLQQEAERYGRALAAQVFADPDALGYLRMAKAAVEASDRGLRLRLLVGPTAAELNALRWELLCDPDSGMPFASSERVLFSRVMLSQDWRPVRLRPKAALRALVAVSAPANLADYDLAPVDLNGEVQRAREALTGIAVELLGQDQPLAIESLDKALRAGFDILYLVAHGALPRTQGPTLFL